MVPQEMTISQYKGLGLQQRPDVFEAFEKLLSVEKPLRIIEVGTGMGGLTLYLRDLLSKESSFYSFDIHDKDWFVELRNNNVSLHIENIFKPVNDWRKYEIRDEWLHVFNVTPKIVLCDGGNKTAEFNGIASLLNPGDIMMLHDYSTDLETFEKLNVWNWLESQYSDIKYQCEQNNLQPYMQEDFLKVAWGCFKKI